MRTVKEEVEEYIKKIGKLPLREKINILIVFEAGVEFDQRWISVEDELPTKEGRYLVKMTDDYMKVVSWVIGNYESCWSCNPKYITHWRPIEIK